MPKSQETKKQQAQRQKAQTPRRQRPNRQEAKKPDTAKSRKKLKENRKKNPQQVHVREVPVSSSPHPTFWSSVPPCLPLRCASTPRPRWRTSGFVDVASLNGCVPSRSEGVPPHSALSAQAATPKLLLGHPSAIEAGCEMGDGRSHRNPHESRLQPGKKHHDQPLPSGSMPSTPQTSLVAAP